MRRKQSMGKTVVYYEEKTNYAKLIVWNKQKITCVDNLKNGHVIGRRTNDSSADVQIDSPLVSRYHGKISFESGKFFYRDLDSSNGTYLNGYHISKQEGNNSGPIQLNNGDVLKIDYRDREKQHEDAVVIIFTTALEYENEWDRLQLNESVTEVPIGREYSSINISSNFYFCPRLRQSLDVV